VFLTCLLNGVHITERKLQVRARRPHRQRTPAGKCWRGGAARIKTAKEPGEKHRRKPFSFGAGKARSEFVSGKRKLFVMHLKSLKNPYFGGCLSCSSRILDIFIVSMYTIFQVPLTGQFRPIAKGGNHVRSNPLRRVRRLS